jgi:hypothetical protein
MLLKNEESYIKAKKGQSMRIKKIQNIQYNKLSGKVTEIQG